LSVNNEKDRMPEGEALITEQSCPDQDEIFDVLTGILAIIFSRDMEI